MAVDEPRGTTLLIGGAVQRDNEAVWQRVVDEAGGVGSRIAVFATAATEPKRISAQIVAALARRGAVAEAIPVAPRLKRVDLAQTLNDPALIARVESAQGVFFSGGAQELIVDTLQPGGMPTEMLQAIRRLHQAGGLVAGSSAGAAVMSRMMFRDAMDNLLVMKGLIRHGHEVDRGLGFVAPELFVDQHFLRRGRIGRLLPAMQRLGFRLGLGVDEDTAAVVKGRRIEIVGTGGAVLVDLRDATRDAQVPAFNIQGVRLSYLGPGDRHDLATGQTWPAARRLAEPLTPPTVLPDALIPCLPDMLSDTALRRAMVALLEQPLGEVRGLAHRLGLDEQDPAPDLGFEFRLYRAPGLLGWRGSVDGDADYTLLNVRADVRPVRMASPLFTPLGAA
ncbi:MAG: cyanophycinase [Roseateles depolymerans]|uniref:Cyanophycinase n=1 Tax=Roseateles depolymerans TaxID=76731 RepID=A0A2W5E6E0_9BURK|nr:MAG: cyanophycinase [Roseateles depolymerans]